MAFNSTAFLIFFPLVCLVYYPLPQVLKKPWLLVCSYYFYMCWNAAYALLILASTLSTWACGFVLQRARRVWRNVALAVVILLNLGLLFTFKYFNFFSASISGLLGAIGITVRPARLGLLLPVGISFYTLQALGYAIDVWRGDIPHERSLLNYALFVSFFPQLVAGPVERAAHFLPQLHRQVRFEERRVEEGLLWMAYGFFKKVAVADGAAVFVDLVYGAPERFGGLQLVLATVLFAVQIYCDFSGYSDIALGAAQVLGFELMRNFRRPYFSTSLAEFWRRWHISLSEWLRDYVYIPLGGNRHGRARQMLNLLIVFLVSGLWHGAAWTFVVWGLALGVARVIGALTQPLRSRAQRALHIRPSWLPVRVWQALFTFAVVCASYVFFRADTLPDAFLIFRRIFTAGGFAGAHALRTALQGMGFYGSWSAGALPAGALLTSGGPGLAVCIGLLFVCECLDAPKTPLVARVGRLWYPARWMFACVMLGAILLYGHFGASGFYYFQF